MSRIFTINQSTAKMLRECAAVGCAELQTKEKKGRCFPFTPFRKIAVEGSFILGDSNWNFFQVGYYVDTHTDMDFLLRVSVTHRPALARLILGRWKERSLWMKPPSLQFYKEYIQTDQRTQQYILTRWHPVQRLK